MYTLILKKGSVSFLSFLQLMEATGPAFFNITDWEVEYEYLMNNYEYLISVKSTKDLDETMKISFTIIKEYNIRCPSLSSL